MPTTARALAITAIGVLTLTGCASSGGGSTGPTYHISAGDHFCAVKPTTVNAGDVSFRVENTGSDVTEVYVYAKQGGTFDQVVAEVENVGPGTTQNLSASLKPGQYQVACKPGMSGDGIRAALRVTSTARTG